MQQLTRHRCPWVPTTDQLYLDYHDTEWGVPLYDDNKLFEQLSLEVAQIGLSWRTVLGRREGYKELFYSFNIERVANFTHEDIEKITNDPRIIRYKRKNEAIVTNAKKVLELNAEGMTLSDYLWKWTNFTTITRSPKALADYVPYSTLSASIANDMQKRGFSFIGKTNIFALLQSIGIINDHTIDCFRYKELRDI